MPQDAKDQELDTSINSALDDDGIGAMPEEGNAPEPDDAASSPAAPDENASSEDSEYLSVVRDVVGDREEKSEEESEAASSAEGEDDGETADDAKPKTEQDDDEYTDVPFHKHPRFQQLLRKSKAYEEDAIRYQNVQGFIDQHGLKAEEAADLLVIGGLIKTNPAEAWARMKPTVQKLLIAAGEVLPPELQERVRKGEMSQAAAIEFSRLQAQRNSDHATRSFEQQRQEQARIQQAQQAITNAATTWEQDRRAKDPNFDAKYDRLMDQVYVLQRKEGVPNTPQGVQDQLNRAYKALAPVTRPQQPAQRQARPTNSGGQVAGNQRPSEMSTLDIIRANRQAS